MRESRLAILFADICESTKLYELLGDVRAQEAITEYLNIMRQCAEQQGGQVIKTIGDEVMVTFTSADAVAEAASEMQERIRSRPIATGRRITIRAGFYFGSVLLDRGDVYGDAVNTAARIAAEAKSQQILTSATTVACMSSNWKSSIRALERAHLKGKQGGIDVVEIIWRREDLTRLSEAGWGQQYAPQANQRLLLRHGANRLEIRERRPVVAIGRADDNDIVIKHNLVSRLHARIEYSKGHFLLVDQSINGTYILTDVGEEHFVRRDSRLIHGSGTLSLGRAPHPDSALDVAYRSAEGSDTTSERDRS